MRTHTHTHTQCACTQVYVGTHVCMPYTCVHTHLCTNDTRTERPKKENSKLVQTPKHAFVSAFPPCMHPRPPPPHTHTTPTHPFRNGRSLTTALNTPTDSVYIFMRALKSGPTPTSPSSRAAAASSSMHASTSAQCSSPTTWPIVLKPWTLYCFMLPHVYQLFSTYRQTDRQTDRHTYTNTNIHIDR